jgi:hypothetical protein
MTKEEPREIDSLSLKLLDHIFNILDEQYNINNSTLRICESLIKRIEKLETHNCQ